ncbi:MAG: hypothetical protein C0615_01140 [Desulfuromonas sp.]|nr:MAG: hypothetical protein C0615_01140 [Desulfuromonas sp.]
MKKFLSFLLPSLFLLSACGHFQQTMPPLPQAAEQLPVVDRLQIADDIVIGLSYRLDRWQSESEAPDFLIEEFVHHIEHELAEKGLVRSEEEKIAVARKRLAANELFIFRSESGAWVSIDFSRLREGERAPDRRAVFNSAGYAAESLAGEEGVAALDYRVSAVRLPGAAYAFRLDADYLLHEEPHKFSGLIAFANPYWFYVYYNDPLTDREDFTDIDRMLRTLQVTVNQ